jgi:alpha-glucosidase
MGMTTTSLCRTIPALSLVCFTISAGLAQTAEPSLASPDGRIVATFATMEKNQAAPAGGQLVYSLAFQGKSLFEPSALRLELEGEKPLGSRVRILSVTPSRGESTYDLVTGKTRHVKDGYNALRIDAQEVEAPSRKLTIEARAYNDAFAFRYVVPEQAGLKEFRLAKESTEFRAVKDPYIWALILPNYRSMYESEFVHMSASSLSNQGGVKSSSLLGLPLLMEVPGVAWAAILEADVHDYAAMYLVNPSGSWTGHWFESRLSPRIDKPELAVIGALPHSSPWRVIQVASEPGLLIESNVLTSLNPEPAITDTSWIRAGRATWDWWNGSLDKSGKHAFTTENMRYYVDFAAQSGFEYMLVDAGWSGLDITQMNGKVDIPALIEYAKSKGVRVWIWLYAGSVTKQMEQAFPLFEKWGVAGMKIDFIERDDQEGIEFYHKVAALAARHHLMVDFHGATKPSGLDRTWPNVLSYEAVLGMEQSKAGTRDNPDSHVTLPFTRMLAGPMDYTPGGFNNVTRDDFQPRDANPEVMGTRAHQLAMYVVYQAPFQMVADSPQAYEGQAAFEFIRNVPANWDETHALNGMPGEFVTIARRRGSDWFLGSMTNWTTRELTVPLKFLDKGKYTVQIYADAADADRQPKNVSITSRVVDNTMSLSFHLAPGGGYAARFVPVAK